MQTTFRQPATIHGRTIVARKLLAIEAYERMLASGYGSRRRGCPEEPLAVASWRTSPTALYSLLDRVLNGALDEPTV